MAIRASAVDHCHELIGRLACARVDLAEYAGTVLDTLRRAVGFDGWCVGMADPASGLLVASAHHNAPLGDRLLKFWQFEFQLPETTGGVSRTGAPTVLASASRRDVAGARRFAELLCPGGVGDELRASLNSGQVRWGSLGLFRSQGGPAFTETEAGVVADLLPALAAGARGTLVARSPRVAGDADIEPGTMLLSSDGSLVSQTPAAQQWVARLDSSHSMLSALVAMLGTTRTASLRTRSTDGLWLKVSGGWLAPTAGLATIAVTIQPASTAEITPLLLRAYGLTPCQRKVARFVLAGYSSHQIAARLHLSPHTVNDHVKAIAGKVGVRTRRQLVAVLTAQPRA